MNRPFACGFLFAVLLALFGKSVYKLGFEDGKREEEKRVGK